MNIILYCNVCGHVLTVKSEGENKVCQYAYIAPCEVCAAQPLLAVDGATSRATDLSDVGVGYDDDVPE